MSTKNITKTIIQGVENVRDKMRTFLLPMSNAHGKIMIMEWSRRAKAWLGFGVTTMLVIFTSLSSAPISAAQITVRSLLLQGVGADGGSKPNGVVNHLFTFTVPNVGSGNIGSIKFEYCVLAAGTCAVPTGLVTTAATLGTSTGAVFTSVVNTTNGAPYATRSPAAVTAGTQIVLQLATVTNPTAANTSFYVRMSTYTLANLGGSVVDTGTVGASTANPIVLTGTMPESLIFCTGATISTTAGIPDCSTATSGNITFPTLFSPTTTSTTTSQLAASTNSVSGYAITINGTTLTSGATPIPALASATIPAIGNSQFGLNLVSNTTLAIGANVTPAPNAGTLRGQPVSGSGYDTDGTFKFVTGDTIARSDNGGAGPTNSQIFTASYIVNVAGGQLAGTYTTTLTYICTSTF